MSVVNKPALKIEDLSFKYPEGKRTVFSQLNLKIPEGLISFVGQNLFY